MGTVRLNAGLAIPRNEQGMGTPPLGFRRALAALFKQSSPGVPTPGRLGANHFQVSGRGDMSYTVTGGGAVLTGSQQGAYIVGHPASLVVATDPSHATNPRIDRIYLLQPDPELDGEAVSVDAIISVAIGTPASNPTAPAIPTRALELARTTVPPGTSRTDTLTFTNRAGVTGLNVPASHIVLASGATLEEWTQDTGWVRSGLAMSYGGRFKAAGYALRRSGAMVTGWVGVEHTGNDFTTTAAGVFPSSVGQLNVVRLPQGWRPAVPGTPSMNRGRQMLFPEIDDTGLVTVQQGLPNSTISKGGGYRVHLNFMLP